MIPVTKPFLPPKEEYLKYIDDIWQRNWLTNNGPLVQELEQQLNALFGTTDGLFVSNGTIAIQMIIKALELKGEIITTPFSYVATTSSIVWESCKPIFVDIDERDFNIDVALIEAAITSNTSAILCTHVFGNVCDIDALAEIGHKHGLPVIYDAAHCFGTLYKGKSVFQYGTASSTSFHATKLFSTIEGGGVFANDPELLKRISYLRNFGHDGPERFNGVGINGKNSEMHAAMGLANLKYIDDIIQTRKAQWLHYQSLLESSDLQLLKIRDQCTFNYSYFPVVFSSEEMLLKCMKNLNAQEIYPRRYFNPSLNKLDYTGNQVCPISESISSRVMTLPLYHDLSLEQISSICEILRQSS